MLKQFTRRRSLAMGVAAAALISLVVTGLGGASSPTAESAKRRSINVVDTVRLKLVKKSGNVIYERGTATGSLPGRVSARFVTSLTRVSGTITFYPRGGGSITMTAVGYPKSASRITRISGNLAVRGGTGKYARALGSGTFSGTANRKNWSVTVNARARLTY